MDVSLLLPIATKYEGIVVESADHAVLKTKFNEDSDTTLTLYENQDVKIDHTHKAFFLDEDGDECYEVNHGVVFANAKRVMLYENLTPMYVLGTAGLADTVTTGNIVNQDLALGLDPVYPKVAEYNETTATIFNTRLQLLLDSNNDHDKTFATGNLVVYVLYDVLGDDFIAIRMDCLSSMVSIEMSPYKVLRLLDESITISNAFAAAAELVPELVKLIRDKSNREFPDAEATRVREHFLKLSRTAAQHEPSQTKGF